MATESRSGQDLKGKKLIIASGALAILLLGGVVALILVQQRDSTAGEAKTTSPPLEADWIGMEGQLVAAFPEFPVYPRALLISSRKNSQETDFEAVWQADQPVDEVVNWYTEQLSNRGWDINTVTEESDGLTKQAVEASEEDWEVLLVVEEGAENQPTTIKVTLLLIS